MEMKDIGDLSFEDRLGLLVEAEILASGNKRLMSRLKAANLRLSACIEDLDLKAGRGLDKANIVALSSCDWLRLHRNVLVTGPTGSGKTYTACALAQKACREGFTVVYERASKLFHDLSLAKATGDYHSVLNGLSKKSLLVIDDFALAPLTDEQRRDLLEIVEDRYNRRSTIVVSQVPHDHWHEIIGDPTIADAILDRLVHNAHKLQLKTKVSKRKEESGDIEF
ncbi:MAG: IS21-like element helper ATPase IstB [Candidatus Obscuribacterales bacterium]|nr:IS21-like element helper ATPase IstB [Candidatus Obscuribacterales bacterium]